MLALATLAALLAVPGTHAAGLNQLMQAAGRLYFGSATDNGELSDSAYVAILKDPSMFGQITPGNSQKWDSIEPSQNQFSYSRGDTIQQFAAGNGQLLRCHNLVWHNQLPNWVSNGQWSVSTLTAVLQNHIANEAGHYKGKCYAWDVVNEALNEDGSYRTDVFYNVLGSSYIPIAFKAAAAADPNAKLYYNDYNIEASGGKQQGTINIIKLIKAAGARIDGVGLQAHFVVGGTPSRSALASVLNSYLAAGVSEVAYTELDIRFSSLPASSSGLQQQAADYVGVVGACLDVAACVGVTIWDYTDKYSWVPGTFSGAGDACLWNSALQPKPAYTSVSSLLAAAAKTSGVSAQPTSTYVPPISVSKTLTTVVTRTSSAATGGPTQARWGQCGGQGWTGPTVCASPYTCQFQNAWYSQCL